MAGTGTSSSRNALLGALMLVAFGGLVAVAVRSAPDVVAPPAAPPPDVDVVPPRPTRARPPQATASKDPPPRAVRVAVTSMDGKPVVGARVELFRGPANESWREHRGPVADPPHAERGVDGDSAGGATLDDVAPGRWFVVASAPGFARHVLLGVTRDGEAGVDAQIALEKANAFSGTVVDPGGAPAAGVVVVLRPRSAWPDDVEALRTTTDARGRYRFDALEAGEHRLEYAVRPGVFVEAARVLVPSLDGFDVRMTRGATVTGTVRDVATGDAVAGARVFAFRYEQSNISGVDGPTTFIDVAVADHLGRFALQTWRPQTEVTYFLVDAPGFVPTPTDKPTEALPGALADGQRFVCDLRVRRAARFAGKLSSSDGPLAGFRVRVTPKGDGEFAPPTGDPWACTTAADGRFVVDRLPVGPAEIWIADTASDWRSLEPLDAEVVAADVAVHDVVLDFRPVRVKRVVVDEDNGPIAGVDVFEHVGPFRASARTDADGRFEMDAAFPSGMVVVLLRREGFRDTEAFLCRGNEDGERLAMPKVATFAGTVVRGDGSPVGGVRVVLSSMIQLMEESIPLWTGSRETVAAADGTFRLSNEATRHDYWLRVTCGGDSDGAGGLDESEHLNAPILDRVRVAGRFVAAESGEPIAGALVRDDVGRVVCRTGTDGRFEVERAALSVEESAQEKYPLHVGGDGWADAVFRSGADAPQVALRRAHAVAGVVRTPDGSPARGLRVVVRPVGDTSPRPDWTTTSATDADGRFVVPGVAAGEVEVVVFDPTHHAVAGQRATTTAGGAELALVVRPASPLVVEIVDDAGKPMFRADVTALADAADLAGDVAEADDDGRVTLGLAPDATYTIRVERWANETFEQKGVRAGAAPLRIVVKSTK